VNRVYYMGCKHVYIPFRRNGIQTAPFLVNNNTVSRIKRVHGSYLWHKPGLHSSPVQCQTHMGILSPRVILVALVNCTSELYRSNWTQCRDNDDDDGLSFTSRFRLRPYSGYAPRMCLSGYLADRNKVKQKLVNSKGEG